MITALLADAAAHRTVESLGIAALMVYAFFALTAGVVRSASSRHAAFWSPPRPHQILAAGRHTEAYRRRAEKRRRRAYDGRHTEGAASA